MNPQNLLGPGIYENTTPRYGGYRTKRLNNGKQQFLMQQFLSRNQRIINAIVASIFTNE